MKFIQLNIIILLLSVYATAFSANHPQIASHWDGAEYNQNAQLQAAWADKFFFNHYQFTGHEKVLDIGSGDGKLTARLSDSVPYGSVIGIDKSQSMVEQAIKNYSNKRTATLHHDLATLWYTPYIYSYLCAFFSVALIIILYFYKHYTASAISIKILASGYVNAAIYALPVITFLLGDPIAGVLGNLVQVILIQPIFLIMLSFINHKEKSIISKVLTAVSTPLVAMPMIGLLCNYLHFSPYPVITTVIQSLGNGASSIALFTFGLTLGSINIGKEHIDRKLLVTVATKNIVHPLIAFCIGKYLFHLEPYWLYSLVSLILITFML